MGGLYIFIQSSFHSPHRMGSVVSKLLPSYYKCTCTYTCMQGFIQGGGKGGDISPKQHVPPPQVMRLYNICNYMELS